MKVGGHAGPHAAAAALKAGTRGLAPLLALALSACGAGDDVTFERMLEQPRYDTYEAGPFFPDGKVLQPPPPGTIPYDRRALGAALEEGTGAVPSQEVLQRGRDRFRIYCAACHGAGGFGGSVVAQNMSEGPAPPPIRALAPQLPAGRIFQVIREGTGRMPSYADVLTVEDALAVAAYARTLHTRPVSDRAEAIDSLRAAASANDEGRP